MELSVSGVLVLACASLVTATPYGYAAKSGAVAKAEASAGADAFEPLPVIPLNSPGQGYSGSFSKSSSSSFASSSASSSSSSFSYSGTGANFIPAFGNIGSGCGGSCNGKNSIGLPDQRQSGSGAPGFGSASATAGAGAAAIPGSYNRNNSPCRGSTCYGTSGTKCPFGQCNEVGINGNSPPSRNPQANDEIDYTVNNPGKEHSSISAHNKPHNSNSNQAPALQPADKDTNPECDSEDCGSFIPNTAGSNDKDLIYNKPSNDLQAPYQEQACTTHDCRSNSYPKSNAGKPSSYNVPILGNPQPNPDDDIPICSSPKCQKGLENNKEYSINTHNVQKPSITLQTPTGPSPCNTKDCSNSYYHNKPYPTGYSGSDSGYSITTGTGVVAPTSSSSSTPNGQSSSYDKSSPTVDSDKTNSYQPTGTLGNGPNSHSNTSPDIEPNSNYGSVPSPTSSYGNSYQLSNPSNAVTPIVSDNMNPNNQTKPSKTIPTYESNIPMNPILQPGSPSDNDHKLSTYQPSGSINTNPSNRPISSSVDVDVGSNYQPIKPPLPVNFPQNNRDKSNAESSSINSYPHTRPQNVDITHSSAHPSYQPSGCTDNNCNPSYPSIPYFQNKPGETNTPAKCTPGNCGLQTNEYSANPSNEPSNKSPSYSVQAPRGPHTQCTTPDCHSLNTNPSFAPNSKPVQPGSSIIEHSTPDRSDVLLSNNGNQIYSGGFGGTSGILSINNKDIQAQAPKGTHTQCTTPNCHPLNISPSFAPNSKPVQLGSSIIEHSTPERSDVLLSNKGNQIYSGGFGGPSGVLSINNKDIHIKPTQGPAPFNVPSQNNIQSQFQPKPHQDKSHENKPQYTGGFGGPAGLLKPNEYKIPSNAPISPCSSGTCVGATASATADAKAVSYTGGFGGPPGLLKPYDDGKLDKSSGGLPAGAPHSNTVTPHNVGGTSGGHSGAGASATATAGSYGHLVGGCNTGCSSSGASHNNNQSGGYGLLRSDVNGDVVLANASASAKSVAGAGSYGLARSVATASAQASAGASTKGGYSWK